VLGLAAHSRWIMGSKIIVGGYVTILNVVGNCQSAIKIHIKEKTGNKI
jgi:hypothetical protein